MGTPQLDMTRVVLLGGGEIRNYQAVAARIRLGDTILCADSGYDHCARLGVTPHLLVGDFDSVQGKPPDSIPRVPFPVEKNYTDATHAMELGIEGGCKTMLMAGMLGGRLDHTIGNLQNLARLSVLRIQGLLTDGVTDVYAVTDGALTLQPRPGCYFSVFSLSGVSVGVNIVGARYLLHNHTLHFDLPHGVSNEFLGHPVTVSVGSGTLVIPVTPMDTVC